MSKVLKELELLNIKPGTKLNGLFSQTLRTVYQPMFGDAETVTDISPYPDDDDMVVVKTKELSERTHMYTSEGEVELPEADRQYVINGVELLTIADSSVDLNTIEGTDDDGSAVKFTKSDSGFDTEFSTFPPDLIKSLNPFINYVNSNKDDLDDLLDIEGLAIVSDGVSYDIQALTSLSKLIND